MRKKDNKLNVGSLVLYNELEDDIQQLCVVVSFINEGKIKIQSQENEYIVEVDNPKLMPNKVKNVYYNFIKKNEKGKDAFITSLKNEVHGFIDLNTASAEEERSELISGVKSIIRNNTTEFLKTAKDKEKYLIVNDNLKETLLDEIYKYFNLNLSTIRDNNNPFVHGEIVLIDDVEYVVTNTYYKGENIYELQSLDGYITKLIEHWKTYKLVKAPKKHSVII